MIEVPGKGFFKGRVSCVLVGNVSKILGGIELSSGSQPDDGLLELGVVTAQSAARCQEDPHQRTSLVDQDLRSPPNRS